VDRDPGGQLVLDVVTGVGSFVHSTWCPPVLLVLIAADGPFPVLPTETLLMSAAAGAFGRGDAATVLALFVVAVLGSVLGDLLCFWAGRTSHRVLARGVDGDRGLSGWVRHHLLRRPGVALVGARFVPGGRLVSTAAAGRVGLPLRRFLPWTVASSLLWAVYMLLIGLALGPITGGSPLLSLAAGTVLGLLTAAVFGVARRVRSRGRAPRELLVAA
jgi:membrane-associated protein